MYLQELVEANPTLSIDMMAESFNSPYSTVPIQLEDLGKVPKLRNLATEGK